MDTNITLVLLALIAAIVLLAFFWRYKKGASIHLEANGCSANLKGSNQGDAETPNGIAVRGSSSGGDLKATAEKGGISLDDTHAAGDMTLTSGTPEGPPDPKA